MRKSGKKGVKRRRKQPEEKIERKSVYEPSPHRQRSGGAGNSISRGSGGEAVDAPEKVRLAECVS